ncbi:putative lipoprotein [Leptospira noguchii str. 1993005606]|uniref:hypothetical protein n=1 Tax=Leptospira noguchii TaxID=28182 RepID=UPI00030F0E91|nr:hypothetical protein [Leptospira noguchii]EPE82031.1 putative lipoprotein [Leptospira noguchii str. 1993005606]
MKRFVYAVLMLVAIAFASCKEKSDFEKYNDSNFKLANYSKIQGVYSMKGAERALSYFGLDPAIWTGSDPCAEFLPQRNVLRMRSGLKGTDVEIRIINLIGDELYFSANGKVARAQLTFNENGNLSEFDIHKLGEAEPETTLGYGQGVANSDPGEFEECLKRHEEIDRNTEIEDANSKGVGPH